MPSGKYNPTVNNFGRIYFSAHTLARDFIGNLAPFTFFVSLLCILPALSDQLKSLTDFLKDAQTGWTIVGALLVYSVLGLVFGKIAEGIFFLPRSLLGQLRRLTDSTPYSSARPLCQ